MIYIDKIKVGYGDNTVIEELSLEIKPKDFLFILGPNGAGKSTLLKSINGILKIKSGDICIAQKCPTKRRGNPCGYPFQEDRGNSYGSFTKKSITDYNEKDLAKEIAFIPQEFNMEFNYTVYEILQMARYPWLNFWGAYTEKDNAIIEKYIEKIKLQEYRNRYFNQLSGGEKQRVLIARALIQETDYILMDESLSHLDINHQIEILKLLKTINQIENKTIIIVSHNLNLAAEFADRILFLKKGEIKAIGTPGEIYNEKTLSEIFEMNVKMVTNPYTKVQNMVWGGE